MQNLIKQIDAKMIRDSGLVLLLGFTLYMLFKVLTNDLNHVGEYMKEGTQVQREVIISTQQTASAIEKNTAILDIIERRLK